MNRIIPLLLVLAGAVGAPWGSAVDASEVEIRFRPQVAQQKVTPDGEPAEVNFEVLRDGEPVASLMHVTLQSPEPSRLLSTDFPVVEGTRLIDSSVVARQGQLELRYVFPIRGRYRWNVTATPLDAPGVQHSQTFDFTLGERHQEVVNFTLLLAALALLGLVAGAVLARGAIQKAAFENAGG